MVGDLGQMCHQAPVAADDLSINEFRFIRCKKCAQGRDVFRFAKFGRRSMAVDERSEEHTAELQSLMSISYAVLCLKKKSTTQLPKKLSQHESTIFTYNIRKTLQTPSAQ